MTPTDKGRHCEQCCKTVIDFTSWRQEDILTYLQQNSTSGTCGRFLREQLNVPITHEQFFSSVTWSPLPLHKKVAAIFLFAFGLIQLSYNADAQSKQPVSQHVQTSAVQRQQPLMGKPLAPHKADTNHKKPVKKIQKTHHVLGGPVASEPDPQPPIVTGGAAYLMPEPEIKGDVAVLSLQIPQKTTKQKSDSFLPLFKSKS